MTPVVFISPATASTFLRSSTPCLRFETSSETRSPLCDPQHTALNFMSVLAIASRTSSPGRRCRWASSTPAKPHSCILASFSSKSLPGIMPTWLDRFSTASFAGAGMSAAVAVVHRAKPAAAAAPPVRKRSSIQLHR